EAVRKGKAAVAIAIPDGFGSGVALAFFNRSEKPVMSVLYDPSHDVERNLVQAVLTEHVMQAMGDRAFGTITRQIRPPGSQLAAPDPAVEPTGGGDLSGSKQMDSRADSTRSSASSRLTIPYSTREEAVTSAAGVEYNGYAHSFAGMGVQFILFMGIEIGIG